MMTAQQPRSDVADGAGSVDTWGAMIDADGKCAGSDVRQKWHPLPGFTQAEYD